jgi:hypothetical protein
VDGQLIERFNQMKSAPKRVLIFSYYANLPGACQAEWIDDKLMSFDKMNIEYCFVSSPSAQLYKKSKVHVRCPSLSWHDYKDEIIRTREQEINILTLYLWAPFSLILGFFVDLAQKIIVKGVGEGRWSWSLTAFLSGLIIVLTKGRPDLILTTGGPASAHIAGIILGKLINKNVVCELQDPLSGDDIGRNSQARGLLFFVEKFLSRHASKLVYVTEAAADYAIRNVSSTAKIVAIHPGSPKLVNDVSRPQCEDSINKKYFKLLHMGSLYSSRNFDTLISAINICRFKRPDINFEVINLGHVEREIQSRNDCVPYIRTEALRPRIDALNFALGSDLLLLIQNEDDRSQVTIPYKTYDYLNLGRTVLGLTNNPELDEILKKSGHISCPVSDINSISENLLQFVSNNTKINQQIQASPFDSEKALLKLITI